MHFHLNLIWHYFFSFIKVCIRLREIKLYSLTYFLTYLHKTTRFRNLIRIGLVFSLFRSWSAAPDMPLWTAYAGVAPSPRRQELYSVGGYRPRNTGPWPTEHLYTNTISVMDYNTVSFCEVSTILNSNGGMNY